MKKIQNCPTWINDDLFALDEIEGIVYWAYMDNRILFIKQKLKTFCETMRQLVNKEKRQNG